jgi:DNA-binding response OmpR family regulator
VRWPADRRRLTELRSSGRPRLLLLDDGVKPPVIADPLEDWIRVPALEADLQARVAGLQRRAANAVPPEIDEVGILWVDGAWAALPPVEARLVQAMLDRFGTVVSRDALAAAAWPDAAPGRNALDVHILRLRRRLENVAVSIRTVRSRGYLLERTRDQEDPAEAQEA